MLGSGLALLAADIAASAANAQVSNASATAEGAGYGAAATGQQITSAFARFLSGMRYEDLSPAAVHEAKRAVSTGPAARWPAAVIRLLA